MTLAAKLVGSAVLAIAVTAMTTGSASAQSFDCSRSTRVAERVVCGSDTLSALDVRMSGLYDQLMSGTVSSRSRLWVRNYQKRFLAARDACGRNAGCIKGAYLDQISVLSARIHVAGLDGE